MASSRYPDTYGDSSFRSNERVWWKAPFRVVTSGGDYFAGVYLVISGFLVSFVLFLRSGPLLTDKPHASEAEKRKAFANLSINFLKSRFTRIWPTMQVHRWHRTGRRVHALTLHV